MWINAKEQQPKDSNKVLGAYFERCGDVLIWQYAIVNYDRFHQEEWMVENRNDNYSFLDILFWQPISLPPQLNFGGKK